MRGRSPLQACLTATAAALAGCAGTDFKRPDAQALTLGRSNSEDVVKLMGSPLQTGELLKNEQKLQVMRYGYAEGTGKGLYPGVTPARNMVYTTFNGTLVSEEFLSSFPEDGTDFDDSKITGIVKGQSTRSDVIALLGKPTGQAIYPHVKSKSDKALIYSYSQVKGSVFNMKFYSKNLVVSLNPSDVVTEVEFTSNGEK
jgi:hypothetical protein